MKSLMVFTLIFIFIFSACKNQQGKKVVSEKPNILLLLFDDLGYGELGCYGQEIIKTPLFDDLAKQGLRFTDFYAGNAVCSSSRAVLMTGKSSSYNTISGNSGHYSDDRWMRVALKMDEMTMEKCSEKPDIKPDLWANL